MDRLKTQIAFLIEIDRVKKILRRNYLSDGSRRENDAEHSWFFAVAALVLSEHATGPVDVPKVLKMALLHDLVEIDAGDTFIYDETAKKDQRERELKAAERIFPLLPEDQADEFRSLWDEFEANASPEAKFARSIDRLSAVILNFASSGKAWKEHGVTHEQVRKINTRIADGSQALWDYISELIDTARDRGYMAPS
jgi:putative hydrolases of HD superfamily